MLEAILANKRGEIEVLHTQTSASSLAAIIAQLPPARDFRSAIKAQPGIAIIAEIKRKSPSRGILNSSFDPVILANSYQQAGARAASVLTDEEYFGGSLDDLRAVRRSVNLPILQKDFILDELQLFEARAVGADAVLLIVAALSRKVLSSLYNKAIELGLQALVEVHSESEAQLAIDVGADIIGINNRDLHTFNVSLEVTARIAPLLPSQVTIVSESGIHTNENLDFVRRFGVHAALVGQSLVTSADPGTKLRQLIGGQR